MRYVLVVNNVIILVKLLTESFKPNCCDKRRILYEMVEIKILFNK